ncbi:MAG: hypothetical protein ACRDG5_05510 [Anaerolineales bacterium]
MDEDLNLANTYRRMLRRWPWISLGTVVGGILGLVASLGRVPVYQSSATIEINVDYNRTAPMSDLTLEQALDNVRVLLLADETLERAIRLAGFEEPIGPSEMRSRIRLAHRLDGWELLVNGEDPGKTAALANAWAEVALSRLGEATTHALRAAEWQGALYHASCQLVPDEAAERPVWVCRSDEPEGDPERIPSALLAEASMSHGILPIFTYSLAQRASIPARPVLWDRGTLVLGGAVAGGGSALAWVILDPWPSRARNQVETAARKPHRRVRRRSARRR